MLHRPNFPRRDRPSRDEVFAGIGRACFSLQMQGADLRDITDMLIRWGGIVAAQEQEGGDV